ncbi:hypothetical protein MiSe_83710 [Microseira wollei NIES-4236]|uniref:Uncharacterized protein n=1 Tax=Microseira wollei NIES-4236 TaxID=2530354 RepID=A0AAV3XPK1_9CYAN|nr:hypothetical protein MiSe_83710 [Microseira wollei NIES-4236]
MVKNPLTGSRRVRELNAVCNAAASNFYVNADAGRSSKYAPCATRSVEMDYLWFIQRVGRCEILQLANIHEGYQ